MSQVLIILGSSSDLTITEKGLGVLKKFCQPFSLRIASAHRSPDHVHAIVKNFEKEGGQIVICVAGKSAHLAGVVASMTTKPVLAVPVFSQATAGFDALLSMSQMPAGIPVATMGFGDAGFTNACLTALQILALNKKDLSTKLDHYRKEQAEKVMKDDESHSIIWQP